MHLDRPVVARRLVKGWADRRIFICLILSYSGPKPFQAFPKGAAAQCSKVFYGFYWRKDTRPSYTKREFYPRDRRRLGHADAELRGHSSPVFPL